MFLIYCFWMCSVVIERLELVSICFYVVVMFFVIWCFLYISICVFWVVSLCSWGVLVSSWFCI